MKTDRLYFLFGITMSVFCLSACAFREPQGSQPVAVQDKTSPTGQGSNPNRNENTASKSASTLLADFTYGSPDLVKMPMSYNEEKSVYQNDTPIVLPASLPPSLTVHIPNSSWTSLETSAFAVFGSEIRELHTQMNAKANPSETEGETVEIILTGLNQVFPGGQGMLGSIALDVKSQGQKKSFLFNLRTAPLTPSLAESTLPASVANPVILSSSLAAIPLKRYEFKNTTQWDLILEVPYLPEGRLLQQVRTASFSQGACTVTTGSSVGAVLYTDRFLLVPEGTSQTQIVKLLAGSQDAGSSQKLASTGNTAFLLYAIYDNGKADPRTLGRNWTSGTKMLSPACGPSQCAKKQAKRKKIHWPNTGCMTPPPWNEIDEGLYCTKTYVAACDRAGNCDLQGNHPSEVEFGGCLEFYIDPIAPIAYNDYSEITGVGLYIPSVMSRGRVYFDNIPLTAADQASPLANPTAEEVLWGSFNF